MTITSDKPAPRTITRGVRLSEAEDAALAALAKKNKTDLSSVVRFALKQLDGWDALVRTAENTRRAKR